MAHPVTAAAPGNETGESPRGRGRPADTGATDLRRSILESAEELFAARGFAATSVRRIADRAGVTPAMIHYYFGSKKALFAEVLDNALSPIAGAIAELRDSGRPPLEHFPGLITRLILAHPHLPALVAREVLLPGGHMQEHFVDHLAPRLGGALPGLVARDQQAGRIRADFDPAITALLVLSTCLFPFLARPLAERALGVRYDEAGIARLESQVRTLLRRGFGP